MEVLNWHVNLQSNNRSSNEALSMRKIGLALFIVTLMQGVPVKGFDNPSGDAAAGKTAWAARRCMRCHGENGEGGFGPDLAGRALTFNQFRQALRKPWGIMPTFNELYTNDQT